MTLADEPRDEWTGDASTTANSSYDPDSFYPASRDKKGFGTTVRITVPPSVLGEVSALVQRGIIPEYRTTHDFFRDAVIHRLHFVGNKIRDEGLQRVASVTAMAARAQYELDVLDAEEQFIRQCDELIRRSDRLPSAERANGLNKVRDMIADHPSARVKREVVRMLPRDQQPS